MSDTQKELLTGEGDIETITHRRVRICCEYCGEHAVYRYTFLLENFRRNPASSAYGRDDCSWCSDTDIFTCSSCQPVTPAGHGSSWGRHTLGPGNHHMFLEWKVI